MPRRAALALTLAASLWTLVLVTAPAALSHPSLTLPATMVYAAASRICHQRPERSFHVAGAQVPVCGRCLGLYVSSAFGALLAWASRRRAEGSVRVVLAVAAVPTAVTWGLEAVGAATFANEVRAIAAVPLGLAAGWVTIQLLRYDSLLNGHEIHDRGPRVHVR